MKKLFIDEGLLLTEMEVTYKGKSLLLKLLVDTGSGSTIIKMDLQQMKSIINLDKLIIEFDC